jgi:hypothetical protein
MRRWLLLILPATGLALSVTSVRLSARSYRGEPDLVSNFGAGRFDGDREWYGYYLSAVDGRLAFELEQIYYNAPPATPPNHRYPAEDAVGLRTPVFRYLPFDGPLGFHYERWYSVSSAGRLYVTRLGCPLWAGMIPGAALLLYPCYGPYLFRRRAKTIKNAFPVIRALRWHSRVNDHGLVAHATKKRVGRE